MEPPRFEVIFNVIIPNARSGIIASYILALGRALGETMAVTMLIGNSNVIPSGLFATGNTMASIIANQFGEASGLKLSSLIAIGLNTICNNRHSKQYREIYNKKVCIR